MFFSNQLIISYIYDADQDRYIFQLTGGEERVVSREQFFICLNALRHFETRRAIKLGNDYHPLPIAVAVHTRVENYPSKHKLNHIVQNHSLTYKDDSVSSYKFTPAQNQPDSSCDLNISTCHQEICAANKVIRNKNGELT